MAVKSLSNSSITQPFTTNSMLGDYESNYFHHLETVRLGGSAASVTFSNLARYSDYQHFQIRATTRNASTIAGSTANYGANGLIRFNNDATAGNYRAHYLQGDGSSATSGDYSTGNTGAYVPDLGGIWSTHTAGAYCSTIIDILDPFDTSKNKTIRALSGFVTGGRRVSISSSFWNSTAAVTSINIMQDGSNFAAGSRFSIYGIKARS